MLIGPDRGGHCAVNVFEAISTRRDVREYRDDPIKPDDLDAILEAGRRSPSSSNEQRWDFVVVTDRSELRDLSTVWQGAKHVASSAATIALVAPQPADVDSLASTHYDLGQTTMCMMLAAVDLGIGSAHSRVGDQDRAREILGFPADRVCPWMIVFGYPADRPLRPIRHPKRRPFDEVVHRGRW
jgi:nitroreductase